MTQSEINGYNAGNQLSMKSIGAHQSCCGSTEIYGVVIEVGGTKRIKIMQTNYVVAPEDYSNYQILGLLKDE